MRSPSCPLGFIERPLVVVIVALLVAHACALPVSEALAASAAAGDHHGGGEGHVNTCLAVGGTAASALSGAADGMLAASHAGRACLAPGRMTGPEVVMRCARSDQSPPLFLLHAALLI